MKVQASQSGTINMKLITINWLDEAACLGQGADLFYSDEVFTPETKKVIAKAKMFCKSCPVVADCLQYAINNDERFGVWGSFSAKERSSIRNHLVDKQITKKQAEQMVNRNLLDVKHEFKNKIFVEDK
jgi:WhiB family redox-sensing transcriptional regulator